MSHWAEIDNDGIVLRVIVGDNSEPDEGYRIITENLGGTWIKTSYNTIKGVHTLGGTPFRGNYASPGYVYVSDIDMFLPQKPFPSWVPDSKNFIWKAPVEKPDSGMWMWDESVRNWVEGESGPIVQ
jgi:hypothetical protein